jgi:disulfide bond formation protein DsbB
VIPSIPSARFWLLTGLIAIGAIATGLWYGDYLAQWPLMVNKDKVIHAFQNIRVAGRAREGLHIAFGTSILVLTLILALITRFAPRSRVILSAFGFLLVVAMAGQIWLGILLTFDGGHGPLAGFKSETANATTPDQGSPTTEPDAPAATQPVTLGQ